MSIFEKKEHISSLFASTTYVPKIEKNYEALIYQWVLIIIRLNM